MLRNVAVLGALHHGKTALCDMLIQSTLKDKPKQANHFKL